MRWRNVGRLHTIPVDDNAEHSLCADCACGPKVEYSGDSDDGVQHIVHNAFDGRDFVEYLGLSKIVSSIKPGVEFYDERKGKNGNRGCR